MTAPAWKWIGGTLYEGDREVLIVQQWGSLINAEACAAKIEAAPELYLALKFILAFYEPGQRYLDTEAWKLAEAEGRAALAAARREMP